MVSINARDEPTTELIGGLMSDAKDLIAAHADRITLEIRGELVELKRAIKLVGVALAGGVLAGLLVAQAIAFGISEATGLPLWASFGIVGVVVALAGFAVYRKRPPSQDTDLIRTNRSPRVTRDVELIADAVT